MPKVKVLVKKDGIHFGDCFISHDAIVDARGPIVRENYLKWLDGALKPCPHKIGTGPEGEDICAYCMEPWDQRDFA